MKTSIKKAILIFTVIGFVALLSLAGAQQNPENGADIIKLNLGGAMAEVTFPHHAHQNVVNDCNVCHSVFPMTPGIIKEKITLQELRKQQVMHGTCLECHKAMKTAGDATGPVVCNQCHIR
jgi:cytochrome c-type protein NrfB